MFLDYEILEDPAKCMHGVVKLGFNLNFWNHPASELTLGEESMSDDTLYEILGVSRSASDGEIRRVCYTLRLLNDEFMF